MTDNAVYDTIDRYLSSLYKNGQILGDYDICSDSGYFYANIVLPDQNALSDEHNNDYVKKYLKELNGVLDKELICEGVNLGYDEPCVCEKPSWYFLSAKAFTDIRPLVCGDGSRPILLYKIPYIFKEKEHYSLLNWQRSYSAMDTLWFNGYWDKFTYRELSAHNSKLNRFGRKICREYEKVLGAPVYYYLHYFNGSEEDSGTIVPRGMINITPNACPQCGGDWVSGQEFYKCDKCRLIADNPNYKGEANEKSESETE
jgi:predicted  nucleic acid-binding Zn ribbon protein